MHKQKPRLEKSNRGFVYRFEWVLPSEVSKRLVRIGHTMRIFTLGVSNTFFLVGGHQFIGQLQMHRAALLFANGTQQPTNGKALLSVAIDLHRNLIARTANSLAANFDIRLHVFNGSFEDLNRFRVLDLLRDFLEGIVEHDLCGRLLAVVHQAIDELAGQHRIVTRVWLDVSSASGDLSHRDFSNSKTG